MTGHHEPPPLFSAKTKYALMLVTLIVLTVADTVLVTILLYYFGERYSQYVNQATGTVRGNQSDSSIQWFILQVYGLVTIPIILYRRFYLLAANQEENGDELTDALVPRRSQRKVVKVPPTWMLVSIGMLNGTGNFFTAIGIPHTRGVTQSLLMLTGIPLVMLLSFLIIGKRQSYVAMSGAFLIVAGATVSSLPSILHPTDDGVHEIWYSVLILLTAQVFFASEKVSAIKLRNPGPLTSLLFR